MLKIKLRLISIALILINLSLFAQDPPPSEFEKKVIALTERVQNDPDKHAGKIDPNSSATLPIGVVKNIGGNIYCVAIDSAIFKNNKSYFSAYMAVEFPGAKDSKKLAFAAKNIDFSPAGIITSNGVKLMLVSNNTIKIGPNIDLYLPGDGSNYIEIDCDGFKQIHFKGEFRIKGDILTPVPANSSQNYVTATLEATVKDLNDIYASISFSPFAVKGLDGFEFNVSSASVDLSDSQNPTVELPTNYRSVLGADLNLWRGFYLESLSVTFPDKLNKGANRTSAYVKKMFIDNAGITGAFGVDNLLTIDQGDATGWGFSVENFELDLVVNKINKAKFNGEIKVAPLDNKRFAYNALIANKNNKLAYDFTITIAKDLKVSISSLKTDLTVYKTSTFTVSDNTPNNKFAAELSLNGKLSMGGNGGSYLGFGFQKLKITSKKPYVHGGTFDITGKAKIAKIEVSITKLQFIKHENINKVEINSDFGIRFGDASNPISFSAVSDYSIWAKYDPTKTGDDRELKFDAIKINTIVLACKTTVFSMDGRIDMKNDDPVFGDLFYGQISLAIKKVVDDPIIIKAGFGKKEEINVPDYHYWFTYAEIPVNIPFGQISLNKFIGGASYHVKQTQTDDAMMAKEGDANKNLDGNIPFVPEKTMGLAVKVGVGFKHTANESIINGKAVLGVSFYESGGLANVNFQGDAYMLVTVAERTDPNVKNKITASISLNYDVKPKIFDAKIVGTVMFAKAIDGGVSVKLHIEPKDWYLWVNRPSERAYLNLRTEDGAILFSANTYFQFGTTIDPLASLPNWAKSIQSVRSASVDNRGNSALSTGNGLSTGMEITANFGDNYHVFDGPAAEYWAYLTLHLDIGFDLILLKYNENMVCTNTGEHFGMNNRYCSGNLYFMAAAKAGGERRGRKKTQHMDLFSMTLMGLLQGDFPKPSHFNGNVQANLEFLGFINLSYKFDFEMGKKCEL